MSDEDLIGSSGLTAKLEDRREIFFFVLSLVGILWYIIMWSIGIMGCLGARRRYRLRPRSPLSTMRAASVPGVSILRPLKGLETNLYENLESTFKQEYPNFEIFFSVADERDQAVLVVRELIAKHPNIRANIVIGEENVGVNPKVNNLIRAYRKATNDILWVIDSNVMVDRGTLARSVDALTQLTSEAHKKVILIHHVPMAFAKDSQLGSRIEEAFLNTNHAKMYIAINTVAIESCVVGKSNLYRRSDVEQVNGTLKRRKADTPEEDKAEDYGLHVFGRFLAEDNMIASALWHELGGRHELSCDVAHNFVGNMSLSDYFWRRVRWIRVRKYMTLTATILEPMTEAAILSIVACSCFRYLFGIPMWITAIVHFGLWLAIDLDVYESLAAHPLPTSKLVAFIAAWSVREILAFPIWLFAILGSEVSWRGQKYEILRNGEARRSGGKSRFKVWFDYLRGRKGMEHYERLDEI